MQFAFVSIAGAALLLSLTTVSLAQPADPVGFVERKRGAAGEEVWIERQGQKIRAAPGAPLYPGDVIRVKGNGQGAANFVQLRVAGKKGAVKVKSSQSFRVQAPPEASWYDRLGTLAGNVSEALGITDRVTDQDTFTRSGGVGPGDEPVTAQVLTRVAALDTDALYAAGAMEPIALRWCGDAADVQLASEGFPITDFARSNIGFGSVDLTDFLEQDIDGTSIAPDQIIIRALAGHDLVYQLKWVDIGDVPRPVTLEDRPLSAADKVEWANWLLADEKGILGDQYNLIAFSLLAEASEEIWVASYMLERASYCPGQPVGSRG